MKLMQELGFRAKIRRKRYMQNQYVTPVGSRVTENLLNRRFYADRPNQKWLTDVTKYRVGDQWVYLSGVLVLYNNEIVS